jgi:putative RecB family exonuclease
MEQPRRLISTSQVQAYLACPLKYRFQYVEKIPKSFRPAALAFGSCVHVSVEWFHRERLAGRLPELTDVLEIFEADWLTQTAEPLLYGEREDFDALMHKGREMLRLYVSETATRRAPAAVEDPFEVSLVDPESGQELEVDLRGIVDLIEDDGTLVDLKTAGRTMDADGLERHLQLSTYALAYLLLYGKIPPLRLDMLLKTRQPRLERLPATRTLPELSWTAQLIREVADAIETQHFFPNPSWRCSDCEYLAHCQKWRGEEPQSQSLLQIRRS